METVKQHSLRPTPNWNAPYGFHFVTLTLGLLLLLLTVLGVACAGPSDDTRPAAPAAAPTSDDTRSDTPDAATTLGETPWPTVTPTPDFGGDEELRRARFSTVGWKTDFSKRSIPLSEMFSGGPGKDGIPAVDAPVFEDIAGGDEWLDDKEQVHVVDVQGEVRAYPLAILIWHEIVNDSFNDVPVAVTYCPLCNSAITFDRRLGDRTLDFGVSGVLRHSDMIMFDRQTESWWQQLVGEAIIGELLGERSNGPAFLPGLLGGLQRGISRRARTLTRHGPCASVRPQPVRTL